MVRQASLKVYLLLILCSRTGLLPLRGTFLSPFGLEPDMYVLKLRKPFLNNSYVRVEPSFKQGRQIVFVFVVVVCDPRRTEIPPLAPIQLRVKFKLAQFSR